MSFTLWVDLRVRTLWHPWVPIGFISLHHGTLPCFLYLICNLQTKASFFPPFHYPEWAWASPGSPHAPHLQCLIIPILLLWFQDAGMLTSSRPPSLPPFRTQSLVLPPCTCLCHSLYLRSHPSFYFLANSYASEVVSVPEGSHLKSLDYSNKCPLIARLLFMVTRLDCPLWADGTWSYSAVWI